MNGGDTGLGIAVGAPLTPLVGWLYWSANLLLADDLYRTHPMVSGCIQLGDGPGLSVEFRSAP
ncbi:hypothetical protein ACIHQR_08470 [Corallococcus coralloides]|uniref:hypothetical protein n=1 Tax=Corallococcus coralloides TaxID=184914 RepID=UPI00384C7088